MIKHYLFSSKAVTSEHSTRPRNKQNYLEKSPAFEHLIIKWRRNTQEQKMPVFKNYDGTPLQCSCLENPREGGAWWAAVYGVAQNQTRLKRLSSSSSRALCKHYESREGRAFVSV